MSSLTKRYAILRNREKNPHVSITINDISVVVSKGDCIDAGEQEINNGDSQRWVRITSSNGKVKEYTR